jgi:hypothetical protein
MRKNVWWKWTLGAFVALSVVGALLGEGKDPATVAATPTMTTAAAPATTFTPTETVSLKVNRLGSVDTDSVLVKGKVTDGSDVYVNDEPARVSGRRWWLRVDLEKGKNDLTVDAEKAGLNSIKTVATVTRRVRPAAAASRRAAPRSKASPVTLDATSTGLQTSGTGLRSIGSFTVDSESTLFWANKGPAADRNIMIDNLASQIGVSSRAANGQTVLLPGTYDDVRVKGDDWTIIIVRR